MSETRSSNGKVLSLISLLCPNQNTIIRRIIYFTSSESVTNKRNRTNKHIKRSSINRYEKEKKEEKKKASSEPETQKSLLGAQSLYKYRPPGRLK